MGCFSWVFAAALSFVAVASADVVTGKIAWMSSDVTATNWDVMLMDRDGTDTVNLSRVNDPANLYSDRDPAFHPKGSSVLFSSRRSGDLTQRIYAMAPDGTGVTALTSGGADIHWNAETAKYAWDGSMVVFAKTQGGGPAPKNCLSYLFVAAPSVTYDIPNTSANDSWPAFSPDGQWVAYQRKVSVSAGNETNAIYRTRLDGSEQIQLTDGEHLDEMPCFSPDGKWVLFKRGGSKGENLDIYRMSAVDGSGLVNLTNTPTLNEDSPTWSWEGDKIAYQRNSSGMATWEIVTANPNGSDATQLTHDARVDWGPTFSPAATATYTIVATAGAGGSIEPSGNVAVAAGSDQTFNITADTAYKIEDVLVDSESVGAVASYRFEAVTENHAIVATFAATPKHHSADYNPPNWQIDVFELARVVTLFNDGLYYKVDTAGPDGFNPTPSPTVFVPGTYHSADYNPRDGRIDVFETLRVVALFNNGLYYKVDPAGPDGYNPSSGPPDAP